MDRDPEAPPTVEAGGPPLLVPPECYPDVEHLIIEDDKPVDNIFAEKQQRLLTEALHSSWRPKGNRPFVVLANVGLFFVPKNPAIVPDVMLSLGVKQESDFSQKENRTYFVWARSKVPDAVIEIVSDRRGEEEGDKMREYAKWGISYYVILDPDDIYHHGLLRAFVLREQEYEPTDPGWFKKVGLGLKLWEGVYEGCRTTWLRWCDAKGRVIPTGREKAQREARRADKEKQRAEKEKQRAEKEKQRAENLAEQLRKLGVDPVE